jgi:hypothetical protein
MPAPVWRLFPLLVALMAFPAGSMHAGARVTSSADSRPAAHPAAAWRNMAALGSVDADVFDLALGAADCAVRAQAVADPATLTIIDYSKPSKEQRLWVYDLRTRRLLYEELVAHGQGSGGDIATLFSNQPASHRTSLGLFVTADTYVGSNGYSLRLDGLESGFNDRARERAIVMHGAPYVDPGFVRAAGRLGRSWGCPALRPAVARELIDTIKGGGLIFAYYPDPDWLAGSKYLGGCAAQTAALSTALPAA